MGLSLHRRPPLLTTARCAAALLGLALASQATLAQTKAEKGIYTCIDERGRRLTADRPIPECSGKEQQILNQDGSVRAIVPPTLTTEERAQARRAFVRSERRERRQSVAVPRPRAERHGVRDERPLARGKFEPRARAVGERTRLRGGVTRAVVRLRALGEQFDRAILGAAMTPRVLQSGRRELRERAETLEVGARRRDAVGAFARDEQRFEPRERAHGHEQRGAARDELRELGRDRGKAFEFGALHGTAEAGDERDEFAVRIERDAAEARRVVAQGGERLERAAFERAVGGAEQRDVVATEQAVRRAEHARGDVVGIERTLQVAAETEGEFAQTLLAAQVARGAARLFLRARQVALERGDAAALVAQFVRAREQALHARDEFLGAERLREHVVRTARERLELEVGLVRVGEQHDGHLRIFRVVAQPVAHLDAVLARHTRVEHDQVGAFGERTADRLVTVVRGHDAQVLRVQREVHEFDDLRIVVGDEHERSDGGTRRGNGRGCPLHGCESPVRGLRRGWAAVGRALRFRKACAASASRRRRARPLLRPRRA